VPHPSNPQSLNRYSYVLNNPLKYIDPTGLFDEDELNSVGVTKDNASSEQWEILLWANVGDATVINGQLYYFYHEASNDTDKGTLSLLSDSGNFYDLHGMLALQNVYSAIDRHQQSFDVFGLINSATNNVIGNALGRMGNGTVREGPGNTMIYESIDPDSITGKLISNLNAGAFTVGYVILTGQSSIKNTDTEFHELGHVTQAGILGIGYLPAYGACWLAAGGWWGNRNDVWNKNIMETGPLHPNGPRR
jgi:hypothetical protein